MKAYSKTLEFGDITRCMKTCTRCKCEKDKAAFSRNGRKADGLQAWCKSCMKVVNASHYQRGYRAVQNQHNAKNRRRYFEAFLELVGEDLRQGCVRCDEVDPACLDFHHLDPSQKGGAVKEFVRRGASRERVMAEVAKCVILCSNCHRKLHYYEGGVLPE